MLQNALKILFSLLVIFLFSGCDKSSDPKIEKIKECNIGSNDLVGCWEEEACFVESSNPDFWRKSIYNFKQDEKVDVKHVFFRDSSCVDITTEIASNFVDADFGYQVGETMEWQHYFVPRSLSILFI